MKKMLLLIAALTLALTFASAEERPCYEITPPQRAQVDFLLEGNPTTGSLWTASLIREGIVTLDNPDGTYTQAEHQEGLLGAPGTFRFTFTAQEAGETILVLRYGRVNAQAAEKQLMYLLTVDEEGSLFVQDMAGIAPLVGQVVSTDDESRTALIKTQAQQEVLATFPGGMALPTACEEIKIWFNGVMTASIPAQINVMGWESIADQLARDAQ